MNTRFIFNILNLGAMTRMGGSARRDERDKAAQPALVASPERDFGGEVRRTVRSTFELITFSAPASGRGRRDNW